MRESSVLLAIMRRFLLATFCLPVLAGAEGMPDYATEARPLIEKLCFKCHGAEKGKGGVRLHEFGDTKSLFRDPKLWEKVIEQIETGDMPPDDKPQPSAEERKHLVEWLEHTIDNPTPEMVPKDPGRPFLHRLSKREYNNTVRDLLGVTSHPADEFPPDGGGGGGFDNNSATLFVPPILVEKYLVAASKMLAEAKPELVFTTRPSEQVSPADAARRTIAEFTRRAYRRPSDAADVEAVMPLFEEATQRGDDWESAIRSTLRAVLVSPNFLFRMELPRSEGDHLINDFELANRLSYFLWSSMPDEELFRTAAEGKLRDPAVTSAQIERMLRAAKAREFAENFAGQWLRVHELETSAQPDGGKFPEYNRDLRDALLAEPIEFFHALLRENGSLLAVLDADYTYANEALARHYGLPEVQGNEFRRVALTDRNRGGVITMGAVLTITSYPQRTSPVLRGKWILEEILGTPPPPPPPLIKSLPPSDHVQDGLTFRQQLEKHRQDANCAGCHSRLDPLGFGLENFDPIGRWRTKIADQPVDAAGQMVTGEKFEGATGLKQVLLARKAQFIRNVTERMYAYALNRGLEAYDMPQVKQTARKLAETDYRIGVLVQDVVMSYPFQYRRGSGPLTAHNELSNR